MGKLQAVFLCIVFVAVVVADRIGKDSFNVDELLIQWASEVQQTLLPLPRWLALDLARRSSALYLPVLAESTECRVHSEYARDSFLQGDAWAVAMMDASSKLAPGLLDGRFQDLGNYDQCLRVREPGQQFIGQHCLVEARGFLPPQLENYYRRTMVNEGYPGAFVSFSLCVPSSCTPEDVITHLNVSLEAALLLNVSTERFDVFCSSKEPLPFHTRDWGAVGAITISMVLILLGTWYDGQYPESKSDLISSFSLTSNWRLLTCDQGSADISCLDGLRCLCSVWVLVVHRLLLNIFVPHLNYETYLENLDSLTYAVLATGSMATESFFVIAGVVRTYSYLRARHHKKHINKLHQCIRRYFRVTPSLFCAILFNSTLAIHVTSGPLWRKCTGFAQDSCLQTWWANMIHISNYVPKEIQCQVHSWYLAADFQLFVLSLLVLNTLYLQPRLGLLVLAAAFVISTLAKTIAVFFFSLHPDMTTHEGVLLQRDLSPAHSNTLYRMGAFVMGMLVGYLLYVKQYGRTKIVLSKRTVWLCWTLTTVVLVAAPVVHSLFLSPQYEDTPWLAALYLGLGERLYIAAISWVILACTWGHGGWVNSVLTLPILRPLSRLTFGVYLMHLGVQSVQVFRLRQLVDYNTFDIIYLCVADVVISYTLAVVMFLTVESPWYRVVSVLLERRAASDSSKKKGQSKEKKKEK